MDARLRPPKAALAVVLILMAFILPLPAHGQEKGETRQNREIPGLDVIILVDESETIWNKTDTEGVRVNTVNYFIDMLSSEHSGAIHRLSIITFETEPKLIPFTWLDSQTAAESLKEQFATLHRSIEPHKSQGYTDINKALLVALDLLTQNRDPSRKSAVIMISDGQPTNPQVSEKKGEETVKGYLQETRILLEQLQDHPYVTGLCASPKGAPLYMIGMGVDKLAEASSPEYIELYREFWQEGASKTGGYYKEAEKIEEMQGISTYIFSELLCTPATPPLTVRSSEVLEYQVFDNYFQIFFTISSKENPDLEARIYRPREDGTSGGIPLSKEEEGVSWQSGVDYEVWGVKYTEPWAGTWQVALEGEGQAEFNYVFFPNVSLKLIEPARNLLPFGLKSWMKTVRWLTYRSRTFR